MAWSILLLLVALLFAVGFIWPGLWFVAGAVFLFWVIAMIVWGLGNRRGAGSGSTTVEGERPRHRVE